MQAKWNILKLSLLLCSVVGLYAFSDYRTEQKKIREIKINFKGQENLYLTEGMVNKLLIQKIGPLQNAAKDKVVLNAIESVLEADKMVKSAQVYLTVDGVLMADILQRHPIGRVEGTAKYYLDDEGKKMPLSRNHSARVPIITGKITGKTLEDVYEILKYINTDNFLRKNVIGIHIVDEANYELKFRQDDFVVKLGDVDALEKKFSNLKAFYIKAREERTLAQYEIVNLEFENQVVCTKI